MIGLYYDILIDDWIQHLLSIKTHKYEINRLFACETNKYL
ncbi:hypothetical protein PHG01_01994 [Streptococcus mutans PKUSS-HG01]|nr:hypothetical protein PHG01_01994 [Streptococcus mutans PKUSS-HG01]ESS16093.1 hypothetical protein PLG01_01988 [Streptococcus mutans PKUSS-LG01]